jgi:hypothetical protein
MQLRRRKPAQDKLEAADIEEIEYPLHIDFRLTVCVLLSSFNVCETAEGLPCVSTLSTVSLIPRCSFMLSVGSRVATGMFIGLLLSVDIICGHWQDTREADASNVFGKS